MIRPNRILTFISLLACASWLPAGAASLTDEQQTQVACTLLLHDLADAYSERDAARAVTMFTPDGIWDVDGEVFTGTDQLRQRLSRLPPAVMIMLTTTKVTPVDRNMARGVSYALAFVGDHAREDTKPHGTYDPIRMNGFTFVLIYRDTFKLTENGWKVAKRTTNRAFVGPGLAKSAAPGK